MADVDLRGETSSVDDHDLEATSRALLDRAAGELRDVRLSRLTRVLAPTALRVLKRRGEYDELMDDVERLSSEIGQINAILERCTAAFREEEEREAERQPGSEVWWKTRRRGIARALARGEDKEALRELTKAWADGLEMQDWERCLGLLSVQGVPPGAATMLDAMGEVTSALRDGTHASALDHLDRLLDPGEPRAFLDLGTAIRLGVLRTRILRREFSDREVIRQSADVTVEWSGHTWWRGLALAALAEVQLEVGEVDDARATVKQATRVDGPPTDALVVFGLLLERDAMWAMADKYYDRALESDRAAIHPVLLRPVPSRLLVRAAVSSAVPVADAVDLLDRALAAGIDGDVEYPEKDVHLARAEKLLEMAAEQDVEGRAADAESARAQAATSLVEAGQRFAWTRQTPRALQLFERACSLAPDVPAFRWAYAEGLRLHAYRADGTLDRRALGRAREQMERGLGLRLPDASEAWVLVAQALIEEALGDPDHDQDPGRRPAVLVERALLKQPGNALAYGFLAGILRRQGFVQEALEASTEGRNTTDSTDPVLFEVHLALVLDHGQYDEALRLLEHQSLRRPDDTDVGLARATVLLRMGRAEDALAELTRLEPSDSVRVVRGHCLFALGEVARSRDEFWSLWTDTRSGPARGVAGWAAFRAGLLAQGIELYRDLAETAPAILPYTRDLGQMLLVNGDLAEGRRHLEEGVDQCPHAEELKHLAGIEFDYVRHATADQPHGDDVAAVLHDLTGHIHRRCDDLLQALRPADGLPALLSAARQAMRSGRPSEALTAYQRLISFQEVPETVTAAVRAGTAVRAAGDQLFVEDDHTEARSLWSSVEDMLGRIPTDADPDLQESLVCRRMLANLVDGHHDEVAAWLDRVDVDDALERTLTEAARTLAHDTTLLWPLRDGLLELAGKPDVREDERRLLVGVAEGLPLAQAYHLSASAADIQGLTFLFVNPLELRLGSGLGELLDDDELQLATSQLQARIEAEMGIRIPWVYPRPGPQLQAQAAEVRVYGRYVGSTVMTGGRETWVPQIMKHLEEQVRSYLFRLIGVDDVELWLEGWDVRHWDAPAWDQPDPRADRLRLARVLRMLLREGVSVGDRQAIVGALNSQAGGEKRHVPATLDTLHEVRRRLGPQALGVEPWSVVPLSPDLEERVGSGLAPDRLVWELPRDEAFPLVTDLRDWLRRHPARPHAVSVRDGRLRPFVWRLLAAENPAVRVLSEEELS